MSRINLIVMDKNYYNTVKHSGQVLIDYEAKALTQQQRVLEYFLSNPDSILTRDEVWEIAFDHKGIHAKPDSIGRCLTNLINLVNKETGLPYMEKTNILRVGKIYKAAQHAYKLTGTGIETNSIN